MHRRLRPSRPPPQQQGDARHPHRDHHEAAVRGWGEGAVSPEWCIVTCNDEDCGWERALPDTMGQLSNWIHPQHWVGTGWRAELHGTKPASDMEIAAAKAFEQGFWAG